MENNVNKYTLDLDENFVPIENEDREYHDFLLEEQKSRIEDLRDPEKTLALLIKTCEGYEEEEISENIPVKVLCVFDIFIGTRNESFLARVECKDGKTRYVRYAYSYWEGTRMCPPEEDIYIGFTSNFHIYRFLGNIGNWANRKFDLLCRSCSPLREKRPWFMQKKIHFYYKIMTKLGRYRSFAK